MKKVSAIVVLLIVILCMGCRSGNSEKVASESDSFGTTSETKGTNAEVGIGADGGIPIFYNMYLSVELSTLFKSINAIYNPKLPNSPDNAENYNISTTQAVNLGVYAVDLSYAKFFDQLEMAGKYLKVMHDLSGKLGIPDDKFIVSIKRVESNMANKDSLLRIANEMYRSIQENLKSNEREAAAGLIIVGGWVEAMYIATNMIDEKHTDFDFLERLEDQKNSIDNLLLMIDKYKTDVAVKEYLPLLYDIKSSMHSVKLKPENIKEMYHELNDVKVKITNLRKKIVG